MTKGEQTTLVPGTALSEDAFESQKILSVVYYPKARYSWATGIAIGRFLRELKSGRIVGTRCSHCSRIVVPPRVFCEWCFCRVKEFVYLSDTGTVNTFSVSYISADATRMKSPKIPAVIRIDGTTDAGFLHLIGETKPEDVKIGMRVKAVWRQPSERTGSILDIIYFKPAER